MDGCRARRIAENKRDRLPCPSDVAFARAVAGGGGLGVAALEIRGEGDVSGAAGDFCEGGAERALELGALGGVLGARAGVEERPLARDAGSDRGIARGVDRLERTHEGLDGGGSLGRGALASVGVGAETDERPLALVHGHGRDVGRSGGGDARRRSRGTTRVPRGRVRRAGGSARRAGDWCEGCGHRRERGHRASVGGTNGRPAGTRLGSVSSEPRRCTRSAWMRNDTVHRGRRSGKAGRPSRADSGRVWVSTREAPRGMTVSYNGAPGFSPSPRRASPSPSPARSTCAWVGRGGGTGWGAASDATS